MNNQQNDDMDRQTLNVAFATQKGGSGKTAITVLVAGYLHYRLEIGRASCRERV